MTDQYTITRRLLWKTVADELPVADGKHGYSISVLCWIVCDNGIEFGASDRYDTHSKTWEGHYFGHGYTVTHWARIESPKEQA